MSSVAKHPDPTTALKHLFSCTPEATERLCAPLAGAGCRKRRAAPAAFQRQQRSLRAAPAAPEQGRLSAPAAGSARRATAGLERGSLGAAPPERGCLGMPGDVWGFVGIREEFMGIHGDSWESVGNSQERIGWHGN